MAVAGVALAALAGTSVAAPSMSPVQQATKCVWTKLTAQIPQATHYAGVAWDSVNNKAYVYGGLNQSDEGNNALQQIDLSMAMVTGATASTLNPSGPRQELFGPAGYFRPKGDTSTASYLGGAKGKGGASQGEGTNTAQAFTPKGNTWTTGNGTFANATLAASAYDPVHDVGVLVGGVQTCNFFATPVDCSDAQNQTVYVKYDPTTGAPSYSPGPTAGGPGKIFGGSLVYDSANSRMLYFGGSTDGSKGKNTTFALNLTDPDLTKATWSTLSTGTGPSARFLHSAAFDADRKWMIINGGVTQNAFTGTESAATDTWALDVSAAAAKWTNLSTNTPSERVGADMFYDTNHKVAVLTAGRGKFTTPSQNVKRDIYYLNCTTTVITPTNTPGSGTVVPPTATGGANPTSSAVWTPPACEAKVCPGLDTIVPPAAIAAAMANPDKVLGYCQLMNPNVPESPWNVRRSYLALHNPGLQYNPMSNSVEFKAGCR
jgi:hypothetical protein